MTTISAVEIQEFAREAPDIALTGGGFDLGVNYDWDIIKRQRTKLHEFQ